MYGSWRGVFFIDSMIYKGLRTSMYTVAFVPNEKSSSHQYVGLYCSLCTE